MPLILSRPDDTAKMNYLKTLFSEVYLKDIVERYNLVDEGYALGALVDVLGRRNRIRSTLHLLGCLCGYPGAF